MGAYMFFLIFPTVDCEALKTVLEDVGGGHC